MIPTNPIATLVAVLVGGALSYLATRLTERARHKLDLSIRWDQRRHDAYVTFMSAVKSTGARANRIHQQRIRRPSDLISEEQIQALKDNDIRRDEAFEALVLLASASSIEAAHNLNHALFPLTDAALYGPDVDEDRWHQLSDLWIKAINDFHAAARSDLKVPGSFARRDVAALAVSKPERALTKA